MTFLSKMQAGQNHPQLVQQIELRMKLSGKIWRRVSFNRIWKRCIGFLAILEKILRWKVGRWR